MFLPNPPHPSIQFIFHCSIPSFHLRLQDAQDFAGVCRVAGVQAIACIGGGVGLQGDLPLEPPRLLLSDFRWVRWYGCYKKEGLFIN